MGKDEQRRREILLKYVEENFNDEQKRVFNSFVEAIDSDEERVLLLNPKFENGDKDKIEVLITLNAFYLNAFYEGYKHKGDLFAIEKLIGEDYLNDVKNIEKRELTPYGVYSDEIQELSEKIAKVSKDLKKNKNIFLVSLAMASKLDVDKKLVSYVENLAVAKARKYRVNIEVKFLKKEAHDVVSFYIELI